MLPSLVPASDDQDEAWRNTTFKEALQRTEGDQMCEVLRYSVVSRAQREI